MAYGRRYSRRSGYTPPYTPNNYAGIARAAANSTWMFKPSGTVKKVSLPLSQGTKRGKKRVAGGQITKVGRRRLNGSLVYRRMNTKYAGSFRRPRAARKGGDKLWYAKHGSVFRMEERGSATSSEAVYVGHSTFPLIVVRNAIARAIVKKLFSIAGVEIFNFDDGIEMNAGTSHTYELQWTYFANSTLNSHENPVESNSELGFVGTDTYSDLANGLAADFSNKLNTSSHDFGKFLLRRVKTGVEVADVLSKIYARDLTIYLNLQSSMVCQNQTNATADGGGADEADENPDNVTANPLKVMTYQSGLWTNGLVRYDRTSQTGATTSTGLIPNKETGIIKFIPTDATNLQVGLYKLPYPHQFLGVNKTRTHSKGKFRGDVLQPGDVKKSSIRFKASMKFATLMNKIADGIGTPTKNLLLPVGNCKVLGFEHVLKMSGDTNVTVGYQVDYTCQVGCVYKKNQVSVPILDIN